MEAPDSEKRLAYQESFIKIKTQLEQKMNNAIQELGGGMIIREGE